MVDGPYIGQYSYVPETKTRTWRISSLKVGTDESQWTTPEVDMDLSRSGVWLIESYRCRPGSELVKTFL